ncbi:hypothetical protein BDR07DRAFT_33513 [Suillus spraguei]|nr:hypothetical protein BDR07DRAFT_33513 [Suillus spraguei]
MHSTTRPVPNCQSGKTLATAHRVNSFIKIVSSNGSFEVEPSQGPQEILSASYWFLERESPMFKEFLRATLVRIHMLALRSHLNTELSVAVSTTMAAMCCAILMRHVNPFQAPSRRHPQSTMRPTGIVAQECLAPMHIWERINLSCVILMWYSSLLARRMSGIV